MYTETGSQLKIKLVEFTGPKIVDVVKQKVEGSNEEHCEQECMVCNGEKRGKCRKRSAVYNIVCRTCAANGIKSVYIGETGNSCYERQKQHWQDYLSNNPETRSKSVLRKHVDAVHDGCQEGVEFEMRVTHIFKNDPTGRQVMEGVGLRELVADHILNSRDEFHQPGELIPVLEGARRNNIRSNSIINNNNNSDNSNNSDNIDNSDNSQVVSQTNGSRRKVTTAVAVAGSTGGVTTRARARRENLVV